MYFTCLPVARKKISELTKRLQQAEDTIKLAAGALKNEKRLLVEDSKSSKVYILSKRLPPNLKKTNISRISSLMIHISVYVPTPTQKHDTRDIKLPGHPRRHQQPESRCDADQLWETASKFVKQTDQINKAQLYKWSKSISYPSHNSVLSKTRSIKRTSTRYH